MRQASRREFHIIYKTTCLITNKYYIGMHSTDKLDDGYFGSGQRLLRSLKKYGKENHIRVIIERVDDRMTLKQREKEIVTEKTISDPLCMNVLPGGFEPPNWSGRRLSDTHKRKLSESHKGARFSDQHKQNLSKAQVGRVQSEATKAKISMSKKGKVSSWNKGCSMSEETKQKMIETKKKNFASGKTIPSMLGRHHTDEAKKKMSNARQK